MKKSSTIRMSMFCPDVPATPFGMMDRNVTKRRGPKSSKKIAESSKLSLRRPEPAAASSSDQENAPPGATSAPLTPRRQGRRLFSRPEIAEIEPVDEMLPPPPPPLTGLPRARPPLRPTPAQWSGEPMEKCEAEAKLPEMCRRTERGRCTETRPTAEPRSCDREMERGLESDAILKQMAEMSLTEKPAPDSEREGAVDISEQEDTPAAEEIDTEEEGGRKLAEERLTEDESPRQRCVVEESPQSSPSPVRRARSTERPCDAGDGRDCVAESEPRRTSSDSFVSAASSPVVGRPPGFARTPAPARNLAVAEPSCIPAVRTPIPTPAAAAADPVPTPSAPVSTADSRRSARRADSRDSDSDSEGSLPYFTPRRPARHRPAAAVLESSDSDDGGGRPRVPLLTRALRRLPATTSTPAPGATVGWRLDATGMPSPVLETEPTPVRPVGKAGEGAKQKVGQGVLQRVVAGGNATAADSSVIMGEYRKGPTPAAQRTLAEETSSSSSVELATSPARQPATQAIKPSPSPSPSPPAPAPAPVAPVLAARAPLRKPERRPAAAPSPMARPPPLPPGTVPSVDVARWLEESPLMTPVSEESDVVVIDSDQEWDDSDLLSVSERAAVAGVEPDSGLAPLAPLQAHLPQPLHQHLPPPHQPPNQPPQPKQPRTVAATPPRRRRGLPRPEMAPQASPPRRNRRQSAGSTSSEEDELEKFKRQFVTPRQKKRSPSPSDGDDEFIDDGPLSSDDDDSTYRRAVAADTVASRTPRVDPDIRASDESPEAAEVSPDDPPFRPPPPRQVVRRPAASSRPAPSPRPSGTLSFMSSLATHLVEGARRHPEANTFVSKFKSQRLQLARRLFDMVNTEVFESKLPSDLEIKFNKRMLRTAGYCYSRQSSAAAAPGADGSAAAAGACRSARVELSEKVVDSAERLRDTLVHELCHAAAWVVSGYRGGHGPVWRGWAALVQRRWPELPPVTRCHSYQIHCKYTYRCTGCGYSFGRHSKSLDVTRKVCGRCRGVFECVLTARMESAAGANGAGAGGVGGAGGGSAKGSAAATPATPRAAAPFALFVKEHYSAVKKSAAVGTKHGDVMKMLGQKFAEAKINQAKAKATECEDF